MSLHRGRRDAGCPFQGSSLKQCFQNRILLNSSMLPLINESKANGCSDRACMSQKVGSYKNELENVFFTPSFLQLHGDNVRLEPEPKQ